MNIVGLDSLVFAVNEPGAAARFLVDYGLVDVGGGRFEALDGTNVVVRPTTDPSLPAAPSPATSLRETVWGVTSPADLDAIEAELARDRAVTRTDGVLHSVDDSGFAVGFQVTVRRAFDAPAERVNSPGAPPQRGINEIGADPDATIVPRTLSHVVYFVPDFAKAEAFYLRLGFVCSDRFTGLGPFLRPAAMQDHHALFLMQIPPRITGVEHFTFHLGGPTEVMLAGTRLQNKGHPSFWGPGRHLLGSNWFWYFHSPFGCRIEYDADMDQHDETWQARDVPSTADSSQLFLFDKVDKWLPGGGPPR